MKKKLIVILSLSLLQFVTQGEVTAQNPPISPTTPSQIECDRIIKLTPAIEERKFTTALDRMQGYGESVANPILPNNQVELKGGGVQYTFHIRVISTEVTIWVNSVAALGYDYSVEQGPKITAVELPKGISDDIYDLWLFDDQSGRHIDSSVDIEGGSLYRFIEPVNKFAIQGIETTAGLNPDDEAAFPVGLRFEKTGKTILLITSKL